MPDRAHVTPSAAEWTRIEAVLDRIHGSARDQWPAVVAAACAGDEALQRRVEALLSTATESHRLQQAVQGEWMGTLVADALRDPIPDTPGDDPVVGAQLGAWRVEREIGRGGMSRVFLTHRTDGAFAQSVAIKVLRADLDSASDHDRFRLERRVLSELDHPNVARLLDSGCTAEGRPYLVLEFVDGKPLLQYCSERGLSIDARLSLFLAVTEGVEASHRQLILHRDIKPSNVIVGTDGRVKLLDFGIAKLLDHAGSGAVTTRSGWLTPEYAAPEQRSGGTLTAATDVFQLGALLYELLTGARAFTRGAALESRVSEDPSPPSVHVRALAGDLDAIVLKALRWSPAARYQGVSDLAADVRRYRAHEPVSARAGSRAYRWRRRVTRHAVPIGVAALLLLSAVGYVHTLLASRQRIARALATATEERSRAQEVTDFMLSLFRATDPRQPASDTVSARTLLARGSGRVDSLARQPEIQAELLQVIGRIQRDLGAADSARRNLTRALALQRQLQQLRPVPQQGAGARRVGELLALLGRLELDEGNLPQAEANHRQALDALTAVDGDGAANTLDVRYSLAVVLHRRGAYAEAQLVFDEWEGLRAQGPPRTDLEYAQQLLSLAELAEVADSLARAERLYRNALSIFEERLGPTHLNVAELQQLLADVEWRSGQAAGGEARFEHAVTLLRAIHPAGQLLLSDALLTYGENLSRAGRHTEATARAAEGLEVRRSIVGVDALNLATGMEGLARVADRAGDLAGAEALMRGVEVEYARLLGLRNAMVARARFYRGDLLWRLGRVRDGEALLVETYRRWVDQRGVRHPTSAFGARVLAERLAADGREAEARTFRLALGEATTGPQTAATFAKSP
ncbi:MAG: serine/threonine protein kinase [Gemmatimonadetes bacterium]|nr:serine/threonine protein kinase [Gemmatimonadota bacterium]